MRAYFFWYDEKTHYPRNFLDPVSEVEGKICGFCAVGKRYAEGAAAREFQSNLSGLRRRIKQSRGGQSPLKRPPDRP